MELANGRRSTLLVGLAVVAGLYWLAMFAGTHIPVGTTPKGDPYSLDKLQHIGAFAVLAVLLCSLGTAFGFKLRSLCIGTFLLIALYGMLDEATQALVSHRKPDVFDWLADMAGAAVGIAAYWLVCRFRGQAGEPNGK
jgi:VanZ family protein